MVLSCPQRTNKTVVPAHSISSDVRFNVTEWLTTDSRGGNLIALA